MDAHSRAQVLVSGCARPGAARGGEGRAHDHRVLTAGTSYARLPMWEMLSAAFLGVRTALNLGEGELSALPPTLPSAGEGSQWQRTSPALAEEWRPASSPPEEWGWE